MDCLCDCDVEFCYSKADIGEKAKNIKTQPAKTLIRSLMVILDFYRLELH